MMDPEGVNRKVILARPDDHRGILGMEEAVDAMWQAFRYWARDPLVAELRRISIPSNSWTRTGRKIDPTSLTHISQFVLPETDSPTRLPTRQ